MSTIQSVKIFCFSPWKCERHYSIEMSKRLRLFGIKKSPNSSFEFDLICVPTEKKTQQHQLEMNEIALLRVL